MAKIPPGTFSQALNLRLSNLDSQGTAYTVSVEDGPHLGVVSHSTGHLELSDQGTSIFINLDQVRSVEVEEI